MRKKINLLILIISMLILNISSSYAAEKNNPNPEDVLLNIALEALETENNIRLQAPTMSTYFVYDFNNRDITASFKNIAYPMYASNNINDLQCYCHNNIKKIIINTETPTMIHSDLSKTVDQRVVDILTDKNNLNLTCTVDYTVRGSITYDPNTYQISTSSTPTIVKRILTPSSNIYPVKTKNEVASSKIAPNKLSADFSYEFTVYGTSDFGEISYGSTSCSFSISPN